MAKGSTSTRLALLVVNGFTDVLCEASRRGWLSRKRAIWLIRHAANQTERYAKAHGMLDEMNRLREVGLAELETDWTTLPPRDDGEDEPC